MFYVFSFVKKICNKSVIWMRLNIKVSNKQNFVRRKIAVWAFGINFKLDKITWIKIIYIQKRVLFFLYKKVLRKAGL